MFILKLKTFVTITSLTAISSLAACGSSGGDGTSSDPTFAAFLDQAAAFEAATDDLEFADPAALPASGSFNYEGVLGFSLESGGSAAGRLNLDVAFATNELSGRVRNIIDDEENLYQGRLNISNGSIDRSADTSIDYTFEADLVGTVTSSDGAITVDGLIEGDFVGDDQRYVVGDVFGIATTSLGTDIIDGSFAGER